jgi:succinylglutamate desuccinylase
MAWPPVQQLMPGGCLDGRHTIDYGAFSDPASPRTAVTVECGRHTDLSAGDVAYRTARRFLDALGAVTDDAPPPPETIHRYRIVGPYDLKSDRFTLTIPDTGFVPVKAGEIVARDGDETVAAPYDAVVIAPRPSPKKGGTAFLWAIEIDP